jgi:small-conductance mechanosensitive channel/CRP-like cAMP-binding protein
MNFWQHLQLVAGMGRAFPLVAALFVLAALFLFALKPAERLRIRTALILFVISFIGLVLVAFLSGYVNASNSLFRWSRWAAMFCGGVAFVSVAGVFVFEVLLEPLRLKPPRIMRDLLLAIGYVAVGVILLSTISVDVTGIVATSAVLTAIIGLSFQDTLVNMMSGMVLQTERAIGVGDWIKIDGQEGVVTDIRWRHTSIETRNWDTIVIPNIMFMKSQVIVLGRRSGQPRQRRQWVYFNVDFRHSPTEVIEIVEATLRAEPIPNVASTPLPNCVLMDFKESYGSYAVRYWLTDLAVDDPTNSTVRIRIYFALRRAGIPLSIPAQSLFVTEDDASRRERKSEQEIDDRVGSLGRVELFETLTDEERQALAARLRVAPFARGEAMTRQGAEAHWLYLITKGEAEVRVSADGNLSERIATLSAGDFFGEMGMMTGEPRAATVVALSDVECYRLDKEAFHDILQRRPELAENISEILAGRRVELEAAREGLDEEARKQRKRRHQGDLLQRMRTFFGL